MVNNGATWPSSHTGRITSHASHDINGIVKVINWYHVHTVAGMAPALMLPIIKADDRLTQRWLPLILPAV